MRLPKSHPFIQEMLRAEDLEIKAGSVTDEVLQIRTAMQERYPEYFTAYILAKKNKQESHERPLQKTSRWLSKHEAQFGNPFIAKSKVRN